jgi:ATP P2X receptor
MPLKLRDLFSEDLDTKFSYRTLRFVIIKDVWLGCAHKTLQLAIALYVIIVAIYLNEGYIKKEFTAQTTSTTLLVKSGSQLVTGSKNTCKLSY